jgi:signal peptidase I
MNQTRLAVILVIAASGLLVILSLAGSLAAIWLVAYYRIPQNGMYPTMPAGSFVVAWRRPYDTVEDVARGDVVVFEQERQGRHYLFVWRVVGLPGETVEMDATGVRINGVALRQKPVRNDGAHRIVREAAGEVSYLVAYDSGVSRRPTGAAVVPPGHLFVVGDNRDDSYDSEDHGPIPFESVVAKVVWWFGG